MIGLRFFAETGRRLRTRRVQLPPLQKVLCLRSARVYAPVSMRGQLQATKLMLAQTYGRGLKKRQKQTPPMEHRRGLRGYRAPTRRGMQQRRCDIRPQRESRNIHILEQ